MELSPTLRRPLGGRTAHESAVGAGLQEEADALEVAVLCCDHQRGVAIAVCGVDWEALLKQVAQHLDTTTTSSPTQRIVGAPLQIFA